MIIIFVTLFIFIIFIALIIAIAFLISVIGGAQYVRTPETIYPKILKLANLKPNETFIELGSGLGHLSRFISDQKSDVQIIGIEFSWPLYIISTLINRSNLKYRCGNIFNLNYQKFDVVYCYLLPPMLKKLAPILAHNLKPGSRVITYGFPIPNRVATKIIPKSKVHGSLFLYEY